MEELPETVNIEGQTWTVSSTLLGKGGFASVYQATSTSGVKAAMKVVDLRVQSSWATAKLRAEAENLRRAQTHDHIVGFYGEVRISHFHVFLLEAWGHDLLDQVLEHRGLGEARSHAVMLQVLKALSWLHDKRICHGCDARPCRKFPRLSLRRTTLRPIPPLGRVPPNEPTSSAVQLS